MKTKLDTQNDEKTASSGTVVIGDIVVKGRKTKKMIPLIILAFVITLAIVIGLILGPQVNKILAPMLPVNEPPAIIIMNEMTEPDKAEILKNKSIEIRNAVIGESRQRKELLVLEQDVEIESVWESAWGGFDIFKKTKKIISFGTGYYNIDLSEIGDDNIVIDHDKKLVSIKIPHAVLKSISVDEGKTQYEDTQKGLLSFGELKLTLEQQGLLKESVDKSMRAELEKDEMFDEADKTGRLMVAEVYSPLVTAILEEYIVEANMED